MALLQTADPTADFRAIPRSSRQALEATLEACWRGALGPKARDAKSHILHVTFGLKRISRLLADIEEKTGAKVPASALLSLGTIEAVADGIERGSWPAPSPLVLLRDGLPDRRVYVIAPGSGVVLELCDLAALLDFPGQIWGLQLPGIDGEATPLNSVHDIARHYVEAIASQPEGAVHLIGYSFGGLVMTEMARIMRRAGRPLGLVAMLDSGCYEKFWPRSGWADFAWQQAKRRLSDMRSMPRGEALRHLAGRPAALLRHVKRRLEKPQSTIEVKKSIHYTGGFAPDFQRVRDASLVAFETYCPRPVEGPAVLFRSALGEPHSCDPIYIWSRVFKQLEIVPVPGSHTTMVRKPFAVTLAAEISARLARS